MPPYATRNWGLSRAEWATTAVAAVVSSGAYVAGGADYLARGVVGDVVGFTLLAVVGAATGGRSRHEALVCLASIGAVLLAGPQWPLRQSSATWWGVFAGGLTAYLLARWVLTRGTRVRAARA